MTTLTLKSFDNGFEPFDIPIPIGDKKVDRIKEIVAEKFHITPDRVTLCGAGRVLTTYSDLSDLGTIIVLTKMLLFCQVLGNEETRQPFLINKGAPQETLIKSVWEQIPCPARSHVVSGKYLKDATIIDGDVIVIIPRNYCLWKMLWTAIRIKRYVVFSWNNPWSLVEPKNYVPKSKQRQPGRMNITPTVTQNARYTPGTNPNGEDLTYLLSQGFFS